MNVPPRAFLEAEEPGEERSSSSEVEMKCVVAGVRGTEIRRMSREEERKAWREALSRPENHFVGMVPRASPVPGTIYPLSFLDSGVLRGPAVKA